MPSGGDVRFTAAKLQKFLCIAKFLTKIFQKIVKFVQTNDNACCLAYFSVFSLWFHYAIYHEVFIVLRFFGSASVVVLVGNYSAVQAF